MLKIFLHLFNIKYFTDNFKYFAVIQLIIYEFAKYFNLKWRTWLADHLPGYFFGIFQTPISQNNKLKNEKL